MAPKDPRLKVMTPEGWVAPVQSTGGTYSTVAIPRSDYFRLFKTDDLVPITEEEFLRKVR